MIIAHNDSRLSWHGHVSLEQTADYTRPWRIPFEQKELFYPDLAGCAGTQAGIRLAFHSNTQRLSGTIVPFEGAQNIDLYVNDAFFGTSDFAAKSTFSFKDIPVGENSLELWLPHCNDFALRQLEIDDNATLSPHEDSRPKWITYGSSITHCGEASSPSFTWPGVVARGRDLNLTCLGYGGQCHLDIQIGRMMRDLPADYISICAGINIYGSGTLNARSFGSTLIGFVQLLREKHPETPLALIS
ncbi:MAG: SGNH/GDSL hydrolase family protein, partial [Abditibacteriaceae bacterium]